MKIYARIDEQNRIRTAQSEQWITDLASGTWHETNAPYEENYEMTHEFREEHGVPVYKLVGKTITARTQAEIDADIAALPSPEPTELERLRADIDYIMMMEDL